MKYLLGVFVTLAVAYQCQAQFGIGVQGGVNVASMQAQYRPEFVVRSIKSIETFQVGLVGRYVSKDRMGLQIEFNMSNKGWRDINDTSDVQYKRVMRYYEVPLLTQFVVGKKKFRIVLEGGAYVAYATSSTEEFKDLTSGQIQQTRDFQFRDELDNRWDYGLMARAGFQYNLAFGTIEAKAFYSYGYGNLFMDKSRALEITQNRVYGVHVAYLYFFRPK